MQISAANQHFQVSLIKNFYWQGGLLNALESCCGVSLETAKFLSFFKSKKLKKFSKNNLFLVSLMLGTSFENSEEFPNKIYFFTDRDKGKRESESPQRVRKLRRSNSLGDT